MSENDTINTRLYIRLLEATVRKYSDEIDIRDIVWVTGRKVSPYDTEISATAKVIKVNSNEK